MHFVFLDFYDFFCEIVGDAQFYFSFISTLIFSTLFMFFDDFVRWITFVLVQYSTPNTRQSLKRVRSV